MRIKKISSARKVHNSRISCKKKTNFFATNAAHFQSNFLNFIKNVWYCVYTHVWFAYRNASLKLQIFLPFSTFLTKYTINQLYRCQRMIDCCSFIKWFQLLFLFMLIMFDFKRLVAIYCKKFFITKIKIIHTNKNEIHKNMTLGEKPSQNPCWINSAWNKVLQAPIKNCYNKAEFVTSTTSVQYNELLLSPLPVSDDIDFEDYVTMTDVLVACVQPDSEAIFNEILSAT